MFVCSDLISIVLIALLREHYVKNLFKSIDVKCNLHMSITCSCYARLMCTFVYFHGAARVCSVMLCFAI